VVLRDGLDVWEKSRPHRHSIPMPSNPQPVTIPTELPGSTLKHVKDINRNKLKQTMHLVGPVTLICCDAGSREH
jgi:hypothetical protein